MLIGIYRKEYERSPSDFVVACHRMLQAQDRDSSMLIYVVKGRQGPLHKLARQDLQDVARDIKLVYPEGPLLRQLNRGDLNLEMEGMPSAPLVDDEGFYYVEIQPVKRAGPRMKLNIGPDNQFYVDIPTPVEPEAVQ